MTEKSKNFPEVKGGRILVCDDDADTRSLISISLSETGFDLIEAVDGEEAQRIVQEELPDVIIMDVMMPRMTGTEFVKWFRKEIKEPFVPILMLTSLADIDDRVVGFSVGVDDYMTKPFNWKELRVRVEALMRVKVLTDALRDKNVQLEEMQQELIEKERELVQVRFSGAAAHNIGQPVTSILLQCRMLEKALESNDTAKIINSIKSECGRISEIVEKLKSANPNKSVDYVSGMEIADIEEG